MYIYTRAHTLMQQMLYSEIMCETRCIFSNLCVCVCVCMYTYTTMNKYLHIYMYLYL